MKPKGSTRAAPESPAQRAGGERAARPGPAAARAAGERVRRDRVRLRVATWNLCSCVGTDGRLEPARAGAVLAELDADVIGLQEVDWRRPPTEGRDQLDYLAARLGMHSVAGPNLSDQRGEYGNGLLSRLAPERHARLDLSVAGREPRGAIDARFACGSRRLQLLVTHLGLRRDERARQLAALRERIDAEPPGTVTVLMGDLNEWRPGALAGRALVPEPFPAASRGRTFPSRFPILALDRILARPTPTRFESRVIRTPLARVASDHLPLVADLEWSAGPVRDGGRG